MLKLVNIQAKLLKMRALLALKEYSSIISETGYILKQDEDNLEALLLRGRAYYYLSDHDIAMRFIFFFFVIKQIVISSFMLCFLLSPKN